MALSSENWLIVLKWKQFSDLAEIWTNPKVKSILLKAFFWIDQVMNLLTFYQVKLNLLRISTLSWIYDLNFQLVHNQNRHTVQYYSLIWGIFIFNSVLGSICSKRFWNDIMQNKICNISIVVYLLIFPIIISGDKGQKIWNFRVCCKTVIPYWFSPLLTRGLNELN